MICRTATLDELKTVLGWAVEEGWNAGADDAPAFYAADPDGFFVAEVDGELVASISVVNHTEDFAFLGLYICRPDHRGKGLGFALWQHALRHAGTRTVGLDGVPDQQANYAASGFVWAGETRRFEGDVGGVPSGRVRIASSEDVRKLTAREAEVTGVAKTSFNAKWFERVETRTTFVLGSSVAFATARQCQAGTKIGPLIAETVEQAETLIRHIASSFPAPIIIDVPTGSEALAEWCNAQEMTVSFGTARMYRGTPPVTRPAVSAVSTLELG